MRLPLVLFTALFHFSIACGDTSSVSIENSTTTTWDVSAQRNDGAAIITTDPLPEQLPALDSIMVDIINKDDMEYSQIILSHKNVKHVILTMHAGNDIQISYCAPQLHCSKEIAAEFTNIHIE